jgi:hypothetical protein
MMPTSAREEQVVLLVDQDAWDSEEARAKGAQIAARLAVEHRGGRSDA